MFNGPQNPGPIRGSNPLIYTGSTPNMVTMNRRPNQTDWQGYDIGHWWIIPIDTTFITGEVWVLVSKANNQGTWKKLHGGGGPTPPGNTYLVNKIYITTVGSGTYTPTIGMKQAYVECVGGGGAGSYSNNLAFKTTGGGGGAYCAKLYTDMQIGESQPYTVGNGGQTSGANGGNTTFSVSSLLITAGGGVGGQTPSGIPSFGPGPAGGTASGGDININGGNSDLYVMTDGVQNITGISGGNSIYGFGGPSATNGQGYGGGGGLGNQGNPSSNFGLGSQGIIIITEYLA